MVNFDKTTKNIDVKLTKPHNSDIIISLKLCKIVKFSRKDLTAMNGRIRLATAQAVSLLCNNGKSYNCKIG